MRSPACGRSGLSSDHSFEACRRDLDAVLPRNPHLGIHTRVASNHTRILRKDSPAVADTVRELALATGGTITI